MTVSTRLKYVAAPAKLCSDDLLLICGRDKLLLSEVLPAPAHNQDIITVVTGGYRPVDMPADYQQALDASAVDGQRRQSVRASGQLAHNVFT